MRKWIDLFEVEFIEPTKFSKGCQVYHVRTRQHLKELILRFSDGLRGMMFENQIDVWQASEATHNAYEQTFGDMGGYRLMIYEDHIELNIMDYENRDDPLPEFRETTMAKKIFSSIPDNAIWINRF